VLPAWVRARLACNVAAAIHRWSFRPAGLAVALRVGPAGLAGTLAFAVVAPELIHESVPRAVYVLEFFIATSYFGLLRFAPRTGCRWLGKRAKNRAGAPRTII